VYNGVGNFEYNDYIVDGAFNADSLSSDIINNLTGLADAISLKGKRGFTRMINANLNVGVDANFWDNRIGLGILSNTRLYNNRLYEEVTIGAALRPCNWFNLAVSYSLLHNGKYSNIGAGISLMPYDGINITLLADYIPTNYAAIDVNGKPIYAIPYKTSNFNIGIGFSIVWGTNKKKKDSDKDGIWDNLDMCPNTPVNVTVDNLGCPLDSDGDGVIDKETTTKTFVGYAPADNPIMSIVVVSPNISHAYGNSSYSSTVNKRIASRISTKFFELYNN
jgi:hypothetical protein